MPHLYMVYLLKMVIFMAMLNNQMVIIVEPNVMGDKTTNYAVGLQTSNWKFVAANQSLRKYLMQFLKHLHFISFPHHIGHIDVFIPSTASPWFQWEQNWGEPLHNFHSLHLGLTFSTMCPPQL